MLFFILYNNNRISGWTPCGVWLISSVACVLMWSPCCPGGATGVQLDSRWTPDGLQVDSRWILYKKLAGLPPKKNCLNSTWTPGVDLESTWNMWGSVKSWDALHSSPVLGHPIKGYHIGYTLMHLTKPWGACYNKFNQSR